MKDNSIIEAEDFLSDIKRYNKELWNLDEEELLSALKSNTLSRTERKSLYQTYKHKKMFNTIQSTIPIIATTVVASTILNVINTLIEKHESEEK